MGILQTGTVLKHGGYALQSRFNIVQHDYAGGEGGYVELLEVLNPPFGYSRFYICIFNNDFPCSFTEFQNLESALKAWPIFFTSAYFHWEKLLKKKFRFKFNHILWGEFNPWFYAGPSDKVDGNFIEYTPQLQLSF